MTLRDWRTKLMPELDGGPNEADKRGRLGFLAGAQAVLSEIASTNESDVLYKVQGLSEEFEELLGEARAEAEAGRQEQS